MPEHSQTLLDLNAIAELVNVEFEELHARRTGRRDPDEDTPINVAPEYTLNVETRDDGPGFRISLRIFVQLGIGEVRVAAVAHYDAEGFAGELTPPLLVEYANEVAIMTLLPYLRHAISDLTQRVFGPPLLMPIVRRGEVTFDAADSEGTSEQSSQD